MFYTTLYPNMITTYYYQSFVGLHKLLDHVQDIDVINISSIHFDENKEGIKNIYLNDNLPNDPLFDQMWLETESAEAQGTCIMLMMGGAGGAYTNLFKEFDTYYPLLRKLLQDKSFIKGIDIDVEEEVTLDNVKSLIRLLKYDMGSDFLITMAPVSESMIADGSGMGGFSYKELYHSYEGSLINWFNVQCYNSFSYETYDQIIKNGYPPEKIVMGMESGQFDKTTFQGALDEVKTTLDHYPTMAGVYDWEYLNAPPDEHDPSAWAKLMKRQYTIYSDELG